MAFHTPRMPQGIQITGISIIKKCSDGAKTVAAKYIRCVNKAASWSLATEGENRRSDKNQRRTSHRKSLWGENLMRKSKFVKWSNRWMAMTDWATPPAPRPQPRYVCTTSTSLEEIQSRDLRLVLHFIACTFAPFQLQTITIKSGRKWAWCLRKSAYRGCADGGN